MFSFHYVALFLQCLKKAVMLDSGSPTHWDALGVISMSTGNGNLATISNNRSIMVKRSLLWIPVELHTRSCSSVSVTMNNIYASFGRVTAFPYHSFVIAGLENFALAQHCFIKSIEVEQNVRKASSMCGKMHASARLTPPMNLPRMLLLGPIWAPSI